MEIIQVKKSPSWTTHLLALEVDGTIVADYSKRSTISPLISRQLSLSHPDRKFKVNKKVVEKKEYLEVTRIK